MTSKRRRRRLRGKFRTVELDRRAEALARMNARAWEAPADYRFDGDEANDAEYGSEALAVLAPLIEQAERRRPFTTAELSPEQIKLIEDMRAIITARPDQADAEFAAAFLAQKGSIPGDVEIEIDDPTRSNRRAFVTVELSPEQVEALEASKMDARHDPLNRLLDD